MLIEVCRKLARQAVERAGGRVDDNADGKEVFIIPVHEPKPGRSEQSWEPGPISNTKFTEEEMKKIERVAEVSE
jgi:hypothetical protein